MIPIPGYAYYFVDGSNIVSTRFNKIKILKPNLSHKGYYRVSLWKNKKLKTFEIHRLIAAAHKVLNWDDPTRTIVDHIDRNPKNNNPENLRYVNKSENRLNSDFI
jgi:hypothetical protein